MVPMGRSPRTDVLLKAEKIVLGGCIVWVAMVAVGCVLAF